MVRVFGYDITAPLAILYRLASLTFVQPPHRLMKNLEGYPIIDFCVNDCLRSVSQVYLCNNPLTGIFILIGCLIEPTMIGATGYGLFTVAAANVYARYVVRQPRGAVRNGLYGFNAFVIGLALPVFLQREVHGWSPNLILSILCICMPLFSVIVQSALNKIMIPGYKCPCLTLPFNIIVIIFLLQAERPAATHNVNSQLVHPSPISFETNANYTTPDYGSCFVEATFKGISQTYLVPNQNSGIIMLVGMAFYSRITCVGAFVGSLAGIIGAILIGSTQTAFCNGLWGYNSSLCFVALCGVFITPNMYSARLATASAIAACVVIGMTQTLFQPWGLPVLTIPFCVVTIIFMMMKEEAYGVFPVPLDKVSVPEKHRTLYSRAVAAREAEVERLMGSALPEEKFYFADDNADSGAAGDDLELNTLGLADEKDGSDGPPGRAADGTTRGGEPPSDGGAREGKTQSV